MNKGFRGDHQRDVTSLHAPRKPETGFNSNCNMAHLLMIVVSSLYQCAALIACGKHAALRLQMCSIDTSLGMLSQALNHIHQSPDTQPEVSPHELRARPCEARLSPINN